MATDPKVREALLLLADAVAISPAYPGHQRIQRNGMIAKIRNLAAQEEDKTPMTNADHRREGMLEARLIVANRLWSAQREGCSRDFCLGIESDLEALDMNIKETWPTKHYTPEPYSTSPIHQSGELREGITPTALTLLYDALRQEHGIQRQSLDEARAEVERLRSVTPASSPSSPPGEEDIDKENEVERVARKIHHYEWPHRTWESEDAHHKAAFRRYAQTAIGEATSNAELHRRVAAKDKEDAHEPHEWSMEESEAYVRLWTTGQTVDSYALHHALWKCREKIAAALVPSSPSVSTGEPEVKEWIAGSGGGGWRHRYRSDGVIEYWSTGLVAWRRCLNHTHHTPPARGTGEET